MIIVDLNGRTTILISLSEDLNRFMRNWCLWSFILSQWCMPSIRIFDAPSMNKMIKNPGIPTRIHGCFDRWWCNEMHIKIQIGGTQLKISTTRCEYERCKILKRGNYLSSPLWSNHNCVQHEVKHTLYRVFVTLG